MRGRGAGAPLSRYPAGVYEEYDAIGLWRLQGPPNIRKGWQTGPRCRHQRVSRAHPTRRRSKVLA